MFSRIYVISILIYLLSAGQLLPFRQLKRLIEFTRKVDKWVCYILTLAEIRKIKILVYIKNSRIVNCSLDTIQNSFNRNVRLLDLYHKNKTKLTSVLLDHLSTSVQHVNYQQSPSMRPVFSRLTPSSAFKSMTAVTKKIACFTRIIKPKWASVLIRINGTRNIFSRILTRVINLARSNHIHIRIHLI